MVLARLQASLDILHGVVAGVDSTQQQMRVQQELQAAAFADGAIKHADTALILRAIMDKLQIGDGGGSERRPPEEEPDPGGSRRAGPLHAREDDVSLGGQHRRCVIQRRPQERHGDGGSRYRVSRRRWWR
jgi:hypothetical protein